jgi:hypothetical protein
MTKNQKLISISPLIYSCFLSLLVFLQVHLFSSDLTAEAKGLLVNTPLQFLGSTFFLLIPNLLLSFFLMVYANAHPEDENGLLILCISSLVFATLMSFSIWIFFYTEFSRVPVIVFGFPVTYFFGMCIGYVVGVVGIELRRGGGSSS